MTREEIASLLGFYLQRLLPAALGILALPWLFEVAGPITYQRYSLVILLTGAISMLCGTWVTQSIIRNLSSEGYSRCSIILAMQMLALSSLGSTVIAAVVLRWAFPDIEVASLWICISALILTLQTTIMAIVQAVGKHSHCLLSELVRTIGPVVVIGISVQYEANTSNAVEIGVAIASAVALLPLWPALRIVLATSTGRTQDPLQNWSAMLRYGGPLSIYNGLSIWIQYLARSALSSVAGNTPLAGSLIMAADLAQKIVTSASAPLIASQVPNMVIASNEGRMAVVNKKIRALQILIFSWCAVLLLCIFFASATKTWIFDHSTVSLCAATAVIGNMLLQLSVCVQKRLELQRLTLWIAAAMAIGSAVSSLYVSYVPTKSQMALPGLDLLIGAATIYSLVVLCNAIKIPRKNYDT